MPQITVCVSRLYKHNLDFKASMIGSSCLKLHQIKEMERTDKKTIESPNWLLRPPLLL